MQANFIKKTKNLQFLVWKLICFNKIVFEEAFYWWLETAQETT